MARPPGLTTDYGPNARDEKGNIKFKKLDAAYAQYQADRMLHGGATAAFAPKSEFAQIWGWKPGLRIGKKEPSPYLPRRARRRAMAEE